MITTTIKTIAKTELIITIGQVILYLEQQVSLETASYPSLILTVSVPLTDKGITFLSSFKGEL